MPESKLMASETDLQAEDGFQSGEDDEMASAPATDPDIEPVALPSGRALLEGQLYSITAAEPSRLCFLLGAVGSGKSTLITSIYHSFLTGAWKDRYYFAGSKTLWALEDIAFYVRTFSMSSKVNMMRTSAEEATGKFLHLRFQRRETGRIENLLLADYSGEQYNAVSANIQAARESFQVLRAAKCIVVLLDGEKFVKPRNRQAELQSSIRLLRTFWDSGLIKETTRIILVVSKYDLLVGQARDSFEKFYCTILDKLQKQLSDLSKQCYLRQVAAMPQKASGLSVGYGVSELFEDFLEPTESCPTIEIPDASTMTSQFNLWRERMPYGK